VSEGKGRPCRMCGQAEGKCRAVCYECGGRYEHWEQWAERPGWLKCPRCRHYVQDHDPALSYRRTRQTSPRRRW
jgi:hypothetical protein